MGCRPPGGQTVACPWEFSRQEYWGVGCHAFLQGIFPTQGLNQVNPHCRRILYHLSHQGSSRILEWATYPFSGGSSRLRNPTGVSCIAGGFFTNWATREAHFIHNSLKLETTQAYRVEQINNVLLIMYSYSRMLHSNNKWITDVHHIVGASLLAQR